MKEQCVKHLCQIANLKKVMTNVFVKHKIVSWVEEAVRSLQRPESRHERDLFCNTIQQDDEASLAPIEPALSPETEAPATAS